MIHFPTYIFFEQMVAVDERGHIPHLEQQRDDLTFTPLLDDEGHPFLSSLDASPPKALVRLARDYQDLAGGLFWRPLRDLIATWSTTQFEQTARAKQLLEWHQNHGFCCRCGHQTKQHRLEMAMICPSCHYRQYPRISPCIIVIIRDGRRILLAKGKRASHHYYGLIAGFVEVGETLEQAVQRETLEEVGIQLTNIQYLGSQPWPFPSNLMLAFSADYAGGDIVLQAEEIADAQFFDIDDLPPLPNAGSIAYRMIQQHIKIIQAG